MKRARMMKFLLMTGKEVVVSEAEIREIVKSGMVIANPYWVYSGLLREDEVIAYLNHKADVDILKRIAKYILVFVENLALTNYMFLLAENREEAEEYLNSQKQLLNFSEQLNTSVQTGTRSLEELEELVRSMISKCMTFGIDPL